MARDSKPVPFDLIPSKWKAKFEARMLREIERSVGIPIESDEYRSLAEGCYYGDLTESEEFKALLSRTHTISILTRRNFEEVLAEQTVLANQNLLN